jgi:predicted MFS family arabinose efflux permease
MVYSLNTALGFFGMGLGAFSATLPALLMSRLGGTGAYRPLFGLVVLASAGNLWLLGRASEAYRGPERAQSRQARRHGAQLRRQENRILGKLVLVNVFNGVAIGLTGPLISYWFALRFGIGPAEIAPVMGATFMLTGASSLLTGRLTERIGIVRSVIGVRLVGLVLMVLLPLMPAYWLAALVYLLRSAFNRSSAGARQALTVGLVRDERRGLATSLNAVSLQVPRSVGPSVAGYLLDAGQFALPFYAAALLQGVYLVAYGRVFRDYEPGAGRPEQVERAGQAEDETGTEPIRERERHHASG